MTWQGPALRAAPFRDFDLQLEQCTIEAVCGRSFVLTTKLKQWLQSPCPHSNGTRLNGLLYADLERRKIPQAELSIPARVLDPDGLVLFSILFVIDETQHLEAFRRRGIIDSHLPLSRTTLQDKLGGSEIKHAESLAEAFYEAQWKFVPAMFRLDDGRLLEKRRIVPIIRQETIFKQGATARLAQIEVLEEFVTDDLKAKVLQSKYDRDDGRGPRYHFALKTFEEGNRQRFNNEKAAFEILRYNSGIVKYLANYSHHESRPKQASPRDGRQQDAPPRDEHHLVSTHNLLLEYGDMDLATYFAQMRPPYLGQEILKFWRALFEVARAVEGIHHWRREHDGQKWQGWHADIKPDNILFIRDIFKLADLGFAKFIPKTEKNPREIVDGRTWAYAAPEHTAGGKAGKVTQKIDIWSLGCVFSIAATWVTGGFSNVQDFKLVRKNAIDAVKSRTDAPKNLPYGALFHDGTNVLDDVRGWHNVLRSAVRKTDHMTCAVLDLVDRSMLVAAPERRMDSKQLCASLKDLVDGCPIEPQIIISSSIMEALRDINDRADPSATDPSASTQRDSSSTAEDWQSRRKRILDKPLQKTSHRSEWINSALKSHGRHERHSVASTEGKDQELEEHSPLPRHTSMKGRPPPLERHKSPHDPQTVFQVREQIDRQEKGKRFRHLLPPKHAKDEILAGYINRHDIKFLVDNSWSMDQHWGQVKYTLKALVMKAAELDDNGMDLSFTRGVGGVHNEKNEASFIKALSKLGNMPSENLHTDMKAVLGSLFAKHITYLKGEVGNDREPKKLLLIILTDGIWASTFDKDEVNSTIVEFIQQVTATVGRLRTADRPVGIQFVQFGDDADATHRLEKLDNDLSWESEIPDVIDAEPADGDVIKMFLGSLSDDYDRLRPRSASTPRSPPELLLTPTSMLSPSSGYLRAGLTRSRGGSGTSWTP